MNDKKTGPFSQNRACFYFLIKKQNFLFSNTYSFVIIVFKTLKGGRVKWLTIMVGVLYP